jgi:DTW domain-containing protein YfiP
LGTQKSSSDTKLPVVVQNRKGQSLPLKDIDGIICLDGNWKQSKTLWWRNPWLLKWPRIYLNPQMSSRFGSLRKEPRKICLSTLEAVAFSLEHLGEKPEVVEGLYKTFEEWLNKAKQIPEETPHE